jgi:hypothetical protein
VGVENLDDPTLFDFIFNFNEKIVRMGAIPGAVVPPKGAVIRRDYFPYQPIRVRMKDVASIAAMKAIGR